MNEIIKSLKDRKSVRVFLDKEIPKDIKNEIYLAATHAPTAGNQQLYTIIDVTDAELKKLLAVSCDDQPFIATAPMVAIFCADVRKWYDTFIAGGAAPRDPGVGDLMLAVSDTMAAAQNAVTAAQSLGIGSCYIGDIMERCEQHREMLNLPKYVFPAAMLVFGYPTDQQLTRKKPERCPLDSIVCENSYKIKSDTELRQMFAKETKNRTFEEWSQAFCERKYNSDFSREMTRSVAEYLKDYEK